MCVRFNSDKCPPRYNGCMCKCHYSNGIKHVMPCCKPSKPKYDFSNGVVGKYSKDKK